jgi:hypothetical protein
VDGNVVRRGVTRLGEVGPRQHGVDGIVEELDTRRIRLTDFSYDGRGARVRVWLYQSSGNIRDGMPIGPDITENDYHQETLVVDIPPEITSDMFDAVSIWCLSAGSSFGQAVLGPAGG